MKIVGIGFDIGHTLINYKNPLNRKSLYVPALRNVMRACREEKDIQGANQAGITSVLINREEKEKVWGQRYTIRNLKEILNIV